MAEGGEDDFCDNDSDVSLSLDLNADEISEDGKQPRHIFFISGNNSVYKRIVRFVSIMYTCQLFLTQRREINLSWKCQDFRRRHNYFQRCLKTPEYFRRCSE